MDQRLERILPRVQKPARYTGGEYRQIIKDKAEVDTRNAADQMVYQTEKTLGEMGDKIPEGEKAPILAAVAGMSQGFRIM